MGTRIQEHQIRARTRQGPAEASQPAERRRLIAENAYFRAQRRGFVDGDPVADWLAAEAEVDRWLNAAETEARRREEASAYHKLRERVRARLKRFRGRIKPETLKEVLEKATQETKEAGEHAASTVNKAARALRKDTASLAEKMGPQWEHLQERASGVFEVWHDRSSEFATHAAQSMREWLKGVRGKNSRHLYRAGELAEAGRFECNDCKHVISLAKPAHLEVCEHCGGEQFHRLS